MCNTLRGKRCTVRCDEDTEMHDMKLQDMKLPKHVSRREKTNKCSAVKWALDTIWDRHAYASYFVNHLKCIGIRWLHLKLFNVIQV